MDLGTSDTHAEASLDATDFQTQADAARCQRNRDLHRWITAAAQGDVPAFEALYNGTAAWLLARVRRIAGPNHAEDVLAEVFLQVWRSLPLYDDSRGEPLAWLATIARSRALDRVRTELRCHGGQLDAPADDGIEESHQAGPEELLATAECASLLRVSMGALSAKERLVLGMAYFRDCSQSEIAALTGLPLGSVKSLMVRSQRKLRESVIRSPLGAHRLPHNERITPAP